MARHPGRYGIRIVASWPWASVLAWDAATTVTFSEERLPVVGAV